MLDARWILTSALWSVQAAQQLHPANMLQTAQVPSPRQQDMSREAPRPAGGAPQVSASRPVMPQHPQVRPSCRGAVA
jgi:hypothetical protein